MATLFGGATPSGSQFLDGSPGIKVAHTFNFSGAGPISELWWYCGAQTGGTWTLTCWDITTGDASLAGAGTQLASQAFSGTPAASAWNKVTLSSPPTAAGGNKRYRVAAHNGQYYWANNSFFNAHDEVNGPISALRSGDSSSPLGAINQGTYVLGSSATSYPTQTGTQANYAIDVTFTLSSITKDVVELYRVLNAGTLDVQERYRVLNAVINNVAELYRVLNAVTKNTAESYRVLNALTRDVSETYRVLNSFTKDNGESYRVLNALAVDKVEAYRILNALTKDVAEVYRVLNAGTKNQPDAWRVFNAFTKDITETYTVLSGSMQIKDVLDSWRVFNSFTKDANEAYRVLNSGQMNIAELYRVYNAMQVDKADTWRVYNAMMRNIVERYNVLSDILPDPLLADVVAYLENRGVAILTPESVIARL